MRIAILLIISTVMSFAQSPTPFNRGRTRCYFGGMSFSVDGKTLYHTHVFQKDTLSGIVGKIAISTWLNNDWSEPAFPVFTNGNESYPLIDNNILYFSSDAALPDGSNNKDQNIWFVERTAAGWGNPAPVPGLNTLQNDRLAFIDNDRTFYVVTNRDGNYDIHAIKQNRNGWSDSRPVTEWNSSGDEEYVSVYPAHGVAFIQRTVDNNTTEVLLSKLQNKTWSNPVPLNYDLKSTQLPYVQRWPQLSHDLSAFYMVSHGIIWQQSSKKILQDNGVLLRTKSNYKPLGTKELVQGEPEVFGGMMLKTNNGISFAPDGKTIYLSRYTNERDSAGRRFIKIFSSDLKKGNWSAPAAVSFNKAGVPFEYHPVLNSAGTKIFYNTRAPLAASTKKFESKNNIWWVEKKDKGWSEPQIITSLATDAYDDYSTPTEDGTLYFRSDRPGGLGGGDIYMSRYVNGEYQSPENLAALNSTFNENDLCVDPKGRFIIFNRYFDHTNNIKLFLSVRTKEGWTKPRPLSQLEKSYDYELTPTLSPDGKYFYYEVNSNILRVALKSLFLPGEWRIVSG